MPLIMRTIWSRGTLFIACRKHNSHSFLMISTFTDCINSEGISSIGLQSRAVVDLTGVHLTARTGGRVRGH